MVGRPSNRDERYAQVMQALVHCVARFGLEGASLSEIAAEAGLTRPLIRHHLGNREEMIAALQDYVLESFNDQTDAMLAALPEDRPAGALVDVLFTDDAETSPDMVLAFAALTARAAEDRDLRAACRSSILAFEAAVEQVVRAEFSNANDEEIKEAAHTIVALYLNTASLAPLAMPAGWLRTASNVAKQVLERLESHQ